jgi:hypothetical protein
MLGASVLFRVASVLFRGLGPIGGVGSILEHRFYSGGVAPPAHRAARRLAETGLPQACAAASPPTRQQRVWMHGVEGGVHGRERVLKGVWNGLHRLQLAQRLLHP